MTHPEGSVSTVHRLSGFLTGPERHFTPLYILGGLILLVESILVAGITQTDGLVQGVLTGFVGLFLLLALVGLFLILWERPQHLYSPSEYGTPTSAIELADALGRHRPASGKAAMHHVIEVENQAAIEEADSESSSLPPDKIAMSSADAANANSWDSILMAEIVTDNMDFEKAGEAFKHVQSEQDDIEKRIGNELLYFYARFRNGDTAALQRLEALAENASSVPERASDAYLFLGLAYQLADSHQKAEAAYQSAIEKAITDSQRAQAIVNIATAQSRLGHIEEALNTIEAAIASTTDSEARAILYEGLARHYDETDQQELKALALEKALEHKPENASLRFDAARAYSASDSNALSLLHYLIILQISPQNSGALNNAGVDYDTLQMRTLAVDSYRKAYALVNTLAAANQAYLYLNAGFAEDASRLLEEAQQQDDPHPNVAAAIAAVSQKREQDEETEKSVLKKAREQRAFLSAYAERYFAPSTIPTSFDGEWQSDEGFKVSISQQSETIETSWNSNSKIYTFKGDTHRGTAKISEIKGRDPDAGIWALSDTIANSGYAYLSADDRALTIMGLKGNDVIFMRLNRID
jgi:tetratricopeptide (TPR) repeat protein